MIEPAKDAQEDYSDGRADVEARLELARLRKPPPPPQPVVSSGGSMRYSHRDCATAWRERPSEFWSTPSRACWREDLRDLVYIAHAVLLLGAQLHGETWNDDDIARPFMSKRDIATKKGEKAHREAWTRIHSVFDILTWGAQAGAVELRIDVAFD